MIMDKDRFYLTADYKKKYADSSSPDFKGVSSGIMFFTFSECLEKMEEWKKTGFYKSFELSVIPAGTLDHYKITKQEF